MSEITQEKMEGAMDYLAHTDDEYGELAGRCRASDHRLKVARAQIFLQAGGTIAEREAIAYTSEDYKHALEAYENAHVEKEIIGAKRERAKIIIDVWRSLNKARGMGQ